MKTVPARPRTSGIDNLRHGSKRTGRNVLALVEPDQEARGQLIISGHHDSAFVFNFLVHQPSLYPLRVTGGIVTLLVLLVTGWVLTVWQAAAGAAPGCIGRARMCDRCASRRSVHHRDRGAPHRDHR